MTSLRGANSPKFKATMLAKYGTDNPSKIAEIKKKRKETNIARYGGNAPACSTEIKSKIKATKIENNSEESAKEKRRETSLQRYGEENAGAAATRKSLPKQELLDRYTIDKVNSNDLAEEFGVCATTVLNYLRRYDIPITPGSRVSSLENKVHGWLEEWGISFVKNYIIHGRKEIDIFLPTMNLGIEINGLYWHHDLQVDKNLHYEKYNICRNKGIRLLQFFDFELDKDVVKSMLNHSLNQSKSIFARNCEIRDVDFKTKKKFLIENHIQGDCVSSINRGLFHNQELVAVMTLGASRFTKKKVIELLRYACLRNISVVGGASKLFHPFRDMQVVSYSNNRFFSGKLYEHLGFEYQGESPPGYFYFNRKEIITRQKAQKHRIAKLLPNFDPSKTEYENMLDHGYFRVWDCGHKIWKRGPNGAI